MLNIVIKSNERIFIAGKTRMGKSYLAREIISQLPRYLIIDPSWENSDLGKIVHTLNDLRNCKEAKIIYQSINPSSIEEFDHICQFAFTSTNYTIMIDEIHLYTKPHELPHHLKNLIVMGAKKGIGLIMISQRPALTNTTCISQSSHIICFNLFISRDIDFFKNFLGDYANEITQLKPYCYLHYDIATNSIEIKDNNNHVVKKLC